MGDTRDVFISYAHADAGWVRTLAENLHQLGLEVFFDEWDIGYGDVLVHKLDHGILTSRNGIIIVSPTALERPYVQEEYAAMMTRAIDNKQRLIPVLYKDVEMPPLLASRVWFDFRNADGPLYLQKVGELAQALKDDRPGRPDRDGELKAPPGTGYRAVGTMRRLLTLGTRETVLSGGTGEARGPVTGPPPNLGDLLWQARRARRNWGVQRDTAGAPGEHRALEPFLAEIGAALGAAYLPPPVAAALTEDIDQAERLHVALELGLEVADAIADLPWQTLRLPGPSGSALALHPNVNLYRRVTTGGPTPAYNIPPPLRILVAIGSPEADNARGQLLDMEAELKRILDAVDNPRAQGKAYVRILENGGVAAINDVLSEQAFHVLYISCHAGPGMLILEDEDGREDRVTAKRLVEEAIPAGRGMPLVVLAGCSTAVDAPQVKETDETTELLPSLARALIGRGVPMVIAMREPVGDAYATALAGEMFGALATGETPLSLPAFAEARRTLERERLKDTSPKQPPPEWATPAYFASGDPLPLIPEGAKMERIEEAPQPVLDAGVVVRRVGDMVGRRREQRLILRALRQQDRGGVLLHGIGGVGKSTLAAQIMHRLARDGWLPVSLYGRLDCDQVLGEVGHRLFDLCLAANLKEDHVFRQISNMLRDPKIEWRERLRLLAQHALGQVPVVFLLDNFEDNLEGGTVSGDLGELLAHWLQAPGKSRLFFTTRYPFTLPNNAEENLTPLHLGPLSLQETRKLAVRLDGLNTLNSEEFRLAYSQVGGHPRALEYLDALLRGAKAKFKEVEKKFTKALERRDITDVSRLWDKTKGKLDEALAETAATASADILLNDLVAEVRTDALAHKLLIGASVYRVPVDETGLMWPVGTPVERPEDPARRERIQSGIQALQEAQQRREAGETATPGLSDG